MWKRKPSRLIFIHLKLVEDKPFKPSVALQLAKNTAVQGNTILTLQNLEASIAETQRFARIIAFMNEKFGGLVEQYSDGRIKKVGENMPHGVLEAELEYYAHDLLIEDLMRNPRHYDYSVSVGHLHFEVGEVMPPVISLCFDRKKGFHFEPPLEVI